MTLPPWSVVLVAQLTAFGPKLRDPIVAAVRETFAAAGYPAPEQIAHVCRRA